LHNNNEFAADNSGADDITVVAEAASDLGLRAAMVFKVRPPQMPAPGLEKPSLRLDPQSGIFYADYSLKPRPGTKGGTDLCDQSLITWYQSDDATGTNSIPLAVSRLGQPEKSYAPRPGDMNKFIYATIQPKYSISAAGAVSEPIFFERPLSKDDIKEAARFTTTFQNFPASLNEGKAYPVTTARPGCWTMDGFKPLAGSQPQGCITKNASGKYVPESGDGSNPPQVWSLEYNTAGSSTTDNDCWAFGADWHNPQNLGFMPSKKGARLYYTPLEHNCGNMRLSLSLSPEKTAGQGFGGANQWMDIGVKFNTQTMSGYALRIMRIGKISNAVAADLVAYKNGVVSYLTHKRDTTDLNDIDAHTIATTAFRPPCRITIAYTESRLSADITTTAAQTPEQKAAGYEAETHLEALCETSPQAWNDNRNGGLLFHFSASLSDGNRVLFQNMEIEWGE
jgi:hypothetical protein